MKWIPVGVRDPSKDQDVLVTVKNLDTLPHLPHFWDRFVSLARYRGDGDFAIRDYITPHNIEVTHWMILPKMPTAGYSKIRRKLLKILQG